METLFTSLYYYQNDKACYATRQTDNVGPRPPTNYYAFCYPIPYWCHWILRQMIVRHLAGAVELCTQCKVYACVLSKMRNSTSSLLLFNLDVCSSDGVRYVEGKAERFVNELQNERNRRSNIHYWILDLGPDVAAFVYDPKLLVSSSSTREKITILQKKKLPLFPWLARRNIWKEVNHLGNCIARSICNVNLYSCETGDFLGHFKTGFSL